MDLGQAALGQAQMGLAQAQAQMGLGLAQVPNFHQEPGPGPEFGPGPNFGSVAGPVLVPSSQQRGLIYSCTLAWHQARARSPLILPQRIATEN